MPAAPLRPPYPRGHRTLGLSAWLCAVALVAVSCGSAGDTRVDAGAAGTNDVAGEVPADGGTLPVLPPVQDREPELFDARGCLSSGPAASDCSTTAADVDAGAAGGSETDTRVLQGFVGDRWISDASAAEPVVLTETVRNSTAGDGTWMATGLARNETAAGVGGIEVHADLLGADGATLATVAGLSPVESVRSGEPVPFELTSEVAAELVADVRWRAVAVDAEPVPDRSLELNVWWARAAGDPEAVDLYLYRDDGSARPELLFGAVTNRAGRRVGSPSVTVAWVDPGGVVLAVETAAAVDPRGEPAADLGAGGSADFMVAVDDPAVAPLLAGATPMLWGAAG